MLLRLFGMLVIGFNAWMMVDAYRRRAETYWLWIIMGVPGGSLAYFFMVKLRDREMRALGRRVLASLEKPPSLASMRRRYERSASVYVGPTWLRARLHPTCGVKASIARPWRRNAAPALTSSLRRKCHVSFEKGYINTILTLW